jgi:hypothetical protein
MGGQVALQNVACPLFFLKAVALDDRALLQINAVTLDGKKRWVLKNLRYKA